MVHVAAGVFSLFVFGAKFPHPKCWPSSFYPLSDCPSFGKPPLFIGTYISKSPNIPAKEAQQFEHLNFAWSHCSSFMIWHHVQTVCLCPLRGYVPSAEFNQFSVPSGAHSSSSIRISPCSSVVFPFILFHLFPFLHPQFIQSLSLFAARLHFLISSHWPLCFSPFPGLPFWRINLASSLVLLNLFAFWMALAPLKMRNSIIQ